MDTSRTVIDENVSIPSHYRLISRTDLYGTILEANPEFIEISGYTEEELINQPHNILRHPDVPKAVFKDMWETIAKGEAWTQIVKNRTKSGRAYWVKANVAPVYDQAEIIGYISIRTPAKDSEIAAASQAYRDIDQGKRVIYKGIISTPGQLRRLMKNPLSHMGMLGKMVTLGVILVLLGTGITAAISEANYLKAVDANEDTRHETLAEQLEQKIEKLEQINLNTAVSMSAIDKIQLSLETRNKPLAKSVLNELVPHFETTLQETIKVHLHTPQGTSFLRSWSDKSGDNLSDFRFSVNQVAQQQKAMTALELGRAGIAVRSLVPVYGINQPDQYVGSIEVFNDLKELSDHFGKNNKFYAAVLTPEALTIATKAKTNPKVGPFTLASKSDFSPEVVTLLQNINWNDLLAHGRLTEAGHFFTLDPIHDARDKVVGYHILIEDMAGLNKLNSISADHAIMSVVKVFISMALLILAFLWVAYIYTVKPLRQTVKTLNEATADGSLSARLDSRLNDEMGQMAKAYNNQMQTTQVALGEAGRIVKDIARGRLDSNSTIPMIGDFSAMKQNMNEASKNIAEAVLSLRQAFEEIKNGNFTQMPQVDAEGEYKKALQDAQAAVAMLRGVFHEVNSLMGRVARGYFNQRIEAEAYGELQTLKTNVNQSLNELQRIIQETTQVMIAQGAGNLTQRLEEQTEGTLAVLKEGINNSVSNMGSILSQSIFSISKLSQNAVQIAKDIEDLAGRTQEQAASIEETAASMEEITSTIQSTAQNAHEANEAATESLKEAQDANEVVKQTITSIREINDASTKISEITSLIDSIAFQTNLLALNAAVEAARAGEHGRGFAVVAGEVRTLASKSADAAKEIRQLIDNTVNKVHEGARLADESGKALELINGSITKISEYISEISRTSAEQAKGVEQVNIAVSSIDQVTQQNSALVDATADRTSEMTLLAASVDEVISTFKIDYQQLGFTSAMENGDFTFAHARRMHRQWKGLIAAYLEGMDVDIDFNVATDHTQCGLGKWFYGAEGQKFTQLPEMKAVEKWHIELHSTIKAILEAHELKDQEQLKTLLQRLDECSENVIQNLSLAETAISRLRSSGGAPKSLAPAPSKPAAKALPAGNSSKQVPSEKIVMKASPNDASANKRVAPSPRPNNGAGANKDSLQTPAPPQPRSKESDEWAEF